MLRQSRRLPNAVSDSPATLPKPRSAMRIRRITLPRYEVQFCTVEEALLHGRALLGKRVTVLPAGLEEQQGAEVVLDLTIADEIPAVTLLFRIIQSGPEATVLEWWARRQTDPALLDLWLHAVEACRPCAPTSPIEEPGDPLPLQEILEHCRRALSRNPFTVLGVHWAASPMELSLAAQQLLEALDRYLARSADLPPKVQRLLSDARSNARDIMEQLSTQKGRMKARSKFVPTNQLRHGVDLTAEKLEVARFREDEVDGLKLEEELCELDPVNPSLCGT